MCRVAGSKRIINDARRCSSCVGTLSGGTNDDEDNEDDEDDSDGKTEEEEESREEDEGGEKRRMGNVARMSIGISHGHSLINFSRTSATVVKALTRNEEVEVGRNEKRNSTVVKATNNG